MKTPCAEMHACNIGILYYIVCFAVDYLVKLDAISTYLVTAIVVYVTLLHVIQSVNYKDNCYTVHSIYIYYNIAKDYDMQRHNTYVGRIKRIGTRYAHNIGLK